MGQKVHPIAFRLGITQNWKSRWFNKKQYQQFLKEDYYIREFLIKKLAKAGIDRVEIERLANAINIIIQAARPGLIIGRGGTGIEDLKKDLRSLLHKKLKVDLKVDLRLTVEEVKGSETRAAIIAQGIVEQIEKRIPFRRVLKQSVERVSQSKDVQGVKVMIKGRLDGNEIARKEWLRKGRIPLQTLRAAIDYSPATAFTTYGTIGVKVWVYKKEVFAKEEKRED
jgi:small subunit ribosomal protein S3